MKQFHGIEPGAAYAVTLYGRDKREARAAFRRFLGVSRLPRGAAVWAS